MEVEAVDMLNKKKYRVIEDVFTLQKMRALATERPDLFFFHIKHHSYLYYIYYNYIILYNYQRLSEIIIDYHHPDSFRNCFSSLPGGSPG